MTKEGTIVQSFQTSAGQSFDPVRLLLVATVVEAKDLPGLDKNGFSDPYAEVVCGRPGYYVGRTSTVPKTRDPHWNETFRILVRESMIGQDMTFKVYDWDKATHDDEIGVARLDLGAIMNNGVPRNPEFDLMLPIVPDPKKKHANGGSIRVHLSFIEQDLALRLFWTGVAAAFDTDGSGTISSVEFHAMVTSANAHITDEQIQALFKEADKNGDGELQMNEFLELATKSGAGSFMSRLLENEALDFVWSTLTHCQSTDLSQILVERGIYSSVELPRTLPKGVQSIVVFNRETGKLEEELIPDYIRIAMRLMYHSNGGKKAVSKLKGVLSHMTSRQGKKFSSAGSRKEIKTFSEFHHLNMDEVLDPLDSFQNFNEFFYRKLKPVARPIADRERADHAVSPADCRLNVFQAIGDATELWIKGHNFTLSHLLCDAQLAHAYDGAAIAVCRLAPQDYHRFHVPVTGTVRSIRPLVDEPHGAYYTVNPIAVREPFDVFTENKRHLAIIDSPHFGQVLFVAVGATMVGSIVWTMHEGDQVKKGDEAGYFAFGGSTVILLFPAHTIAFDEDLLRNSKSQVETLVKMGASLGTKH